MKQFILFLFLVTSVSIQSVNAQDIGDEFVDPTLNTSDLLDEPNNFESPPPEFQPSTENNAAENIGTSNNIGSEAIPLETDFQPEPLAIENNSSVSSSGGDVVVEQQTDLSESYKKRRGKHGVLFSLNYEKYYPVDYFSMYRDKYIDEFLGDDESMDLISVELGYKLNFKLGSLALLGNYAQGSKANENYSEDNGVTKNERNLGVTRYGLSANFALDNVLEEPWIVPYGQVGIHQFQVAEDNLATEAAEETTTQFAFNYRIGLLFQLNWIEKSIDPNTQLEGLRSSGLQNTFIDLYAMTHMASTETYDPADPNSEGDPDMSTGMEMGIGLKMEF